MMLHFISGGSLCHLSLGEKNYYAAYYFLNHTKYHKFFSHNVAHFLRKPGNHKKTFSRE